MLDNILHNTKKLIPRKIFSFFQPAYHLSLALLAALIYRFPSKKIKVIAVTGTKGKSSVTEIINAIIEESGYKTAVMNTIRFKIGDESKQNLHKMSMPGRFTVQRMLRKAVTNNCDFMIMEITSQGALFYRDRFIDLDALIMTNVTPEHIEAHGSYENYINAKVGIAKRLNKSSKPNPTLIINLDDPASIRFTTDFKHKIVGYSLKNVEPYTIKVSGIDFHFEKQKISSPLSGLFNLQNILASITATKSFGAKNENIKKAIGKFSLIPGRLEKIECGQDFLVVVDYAHTTDSLRKVYETIPNSRKICVLGGTGGGRDAWKRSEMGRVAETYCSEIILTNEDPYDEDPNKIIEDIKSGIKNKTVNIIMDRKEAIKKALELASTGDAVIITGKGTDPYIMGPNNTKTAWNDAKITHQELENILKAHRGI
jgi:UDP-N-acetylmuramoyl-L-alanyl-D-glutamate--2,6-diaminopimelate ligase